MSLTGLPFSNETRRAIVRAANGFIPLDAWVNKAFNPSPSSPWRNGERLDAQALRLPDFFDRLLRETSGDADLKARWDSFAAVPLRSCPITDVAAWRQNRGLDPQPVFAITMSDAVLTDVETREISRADFYGVYWAPLAAAYAAADMAALADGQAVDEADFVARLLADTNRFWPLYNSWKSSRFAKQFVKDVLYCYLGLRGLAPEPWAEAVLIELGEGRRVGNKYSSADASSAVDHFNAVLRDLMTRGDSHPMVDLGRVFFTQPIGSPPVNARDL